MATLSLDLRERIVRAYDKGEGTREEIAQRFSVSLGMVKKLLQQRRQTGCIKPRHHLAGRKKLIVATHRIAIRQHLKRKPDMTLAELREALSLECTLPAIHYVLVDMGLTYKKDTPRRRAGPRRLPPRAAALEAQTRRARALAARLS
jgi:transposase